MSKKCLKCGYLRSSSDTAPDYECPNCGAVYAKVEAAILKAQQQSQASQSPDDTTEAGDEKALTKPCPHCAEEILVAAMKCKHCKSDLVDPEASPERPKSNHKLAACKSCKKEVSKSAKACPHCGQQNPTVGGASILASVVSITVAVIFIASIFGGSDSGAGTKPSKRASPTRATDAIYPCKEFVKRRLKAPSTAEFPWSGQKAAKTAHGTYVVQSYVDAQNGFGAMIRNHYVCEVVRTDNKWKLEDVVVITQ